MTAKVIPWSFSSWNDYNTCPYRFYNERILKKYKMPDSQPIIWGNTVHKAIELYGKHGTPLPDTVTRFKPIVDKIRDAPGENHVEVELAMTKDLKPTGFWDDDAWCRGKGDWIKKNKSVALSVDWKTGKIKPNSLQLELMTVLTFVYAPEVERQTTMFMWFQDPSKPTIGRYTREDIPRIMAQFESGVKDMEWSLEHDTWPKKPSGLCKSWCPVKDCPYYGRGSSNYGRR